MDANGVLAVVFDRAHSQLKTTTVAGTSTTSPKTHSAEWVWEKVFDPATGTVRVISV